MTSIKNIIYFLAIMVLLYACSSTKHLKPGEILYTGAEVRLNPDTAPKYKGQKDFQIALMERTRPKPNKSILGFRNKLFFYNLAGEPKKDKGFRYWMRNKLGEPPVLLNQVNTNTNVNILNSYMLSKGFLQTEGKGEKVAKGKKGKAVYTIMSGHRYKIRDVSFPKEGSSKLFRLIQESAAKTLLKKGNYYDLDVFKLERERIDEILKQNGYYYFNPDFILLQVDSTIGNNEVNIYLKVKDNTPYAAMHPYYIRNINIFPNYTLNRDSVNRRSSPVSYKDFNIYDPLNRYKPQLFENLVFFEKGEKYNRTDHSLSLNRLVSIGTFKFVKAEFKPLDTLRSDSMDLDFLLTSLKRKALTLDVTGTSKSNNFVGSQLKITYTNRNVFKGAEQLKISASGGFETQVGGQAGGVNSNSLGLDASLIFPRIVLPIFNIKNYTAYVPKTHVTIGGQRLQRSKFYTLVSGKFEFGYLWKGNQFSEHQLNPISINYIKTTNTTDSFNRMLEQIPSLKKNFENQFIIGTNYTYTYTNQMQDARRNNFLFIANAESAGNLINLFLSENDAGQKTLFNAATNQFIRLEGDFRDYYKLNNRGLIWANRLNIGIGIPYGNSTALPYVRQFFAGGSNDIRAFRARSLGPGGFYAQTNSGSRLFLEQGGDVKVMLNSELRAKLFSVLQGAVFIDAGNIWLSREDADRPGAKFSFGNMFNQMAVGGGVGLRVDASIFVIRFDLAMPLRKPYLENKWVLDQINFGNSQWRKDNLILNIGIGYPF
ncbi:MAG: BamA/TamA family outer membrane protein [Niabella sp.]